MSDPKRTKAESADQRHLFSRVSKAYHALEREVQDAGKAVIELLKVHNRGWRTAISAEKLLKNRGISQRQWRKVVAYHRLCGHPVGSSPDGYFWCVTLEDIEVTERHLRGRLAALEEDLAGWAMARRTIEMGCAQVSMI